MNKTDGQLKRDVEAELGYDPKINAAQIGVTVDHGVVSLLGSVDTYAEKWAAEEATRRVHGVRTIAQELTVKLLTEHKRDDAEIAAAAMNALKWDVFIPKGVTVSVQSGTARLEGDVDWNYQRECVEYVVRHLTGVVNVNNYIKVKPRVASRDVKKEIRAALQRQGTSEGNSIHVDTTGTTVTLSGEASSWKSLNDAAQAAWAAPGVTEVVDRMTVSALS